MQPLALWLFQGETSTRNPMTSLYHLIGYLTFYLIYSNSAEGYLEQIDVLLNNTNLNSNTASFSIFINQLGKLLKRLEQIEVKNQVQKVMGN